MIGQFFYAVFGQPILNILVAFYKLFLLAKIPGAFGWAIIALTLFIRLILHPFFKQQMDTARKMQEVKPHLDRLSAKYKKDPKKLQEEQMKMYRQMGLNPASGCLMPLIQLPVFYALYTTLSHFLSTNNQKLIAQINKDLYSPALKITAIDPIFFGLNLAATPALAAKAGQWYMYVIPVITGLLQYFQVQLSTPATVPAAAVKKEEAGKDGKKKEPGTGEDFQKAMNMQMKYFFPVMIGWFSLNLPIGLAFYWNIFSLFSIVQGYSMRKAKEVKS